MADETRFAATPKARGDSAIARLRRLARVVGLGSRPLPPVIHRLGPVEVVSWRPPGGAQNFGDELSLAVTKRLAGEQAGLFETDERHRLLAVGSLLHFARPGDVVWGTGALNAGWRRPGAGAIDIRAVRGPLTAAEIERAGLPCPRVFGDPAMLLPSLFAGEFSAAKGGGGIVVVPHFTDLAVLADEPRVVSPLLPWQECVAAIAAADFVIASSLHGLIVAEAFGVPARWLRLPGAADRFKFDDHALATGRERLIPASSVAEALDLGPDRSPQFDPAPLRQAFPFDLWGRA